VSTVADDHTQIVGLEYTALSPRCVNTLVRKGISTVGQLRASRDCLGQGIGHSMKRDIDALLEHGSASFPSVA
jgi:hypothetical protein